MKKFLAMLLAACMLLSLMAGCGSQEKATAADGDMIALITMDSIDQHWITLKEGAEKAAADLGVELQFMAPNTKDDAQQIECVNNAVSAGAKAIIVAANGPDAISSALKEAADKGVKIVYVDSPANVPAEATFSTDNEAAGKQAGQTMLDALTEAGVTEGAIGIINVNAATASCVARETGFRAAFEGTAYELLETQYGEGDAAKSQSIAENYITQGVVGIFGANEGSTTGAGNAIKASGKSNIIGVGFDKSDAILGLIEDGYLLATMAQNPDVMGIEGVKAAVAAIAGESLGGAVTDTGVSVLKAEGGASAAAPAANDYKIALITMDSIDQHWITLKEGAEKAAADLGVELSFMAPNTKDDAQQIECVNNAVAAGCDAIIVAANGPDAISSALQEAANKGVKIVYVDSPANVPAEATFSTDNEAAGKQAGQTMLDALTAAGVTEGAIGIINVNAATASCVARESGFRAAFEGTAFELLETQYGEGDAAKSQSIAENYVTQGVVGIFGANEGSTTGAGNAIKASGKDSIIGVGFDKSDAILGLIQDGYLLATMAQNPDVMGSEGVKAAVAALNGESLGGAVTDTGVSVLTK